MSKVNMKIASVLLGYAILVTSVFVICIMSFASYSSNDKINVYLNNENIELDNSINQTFDSNNEESQITSDQQRIEDLQNYANYFHDQLIKQIAFTAIFFCIFLIFSSIILWMILKRIQKNENILIAKQLNSIQEMNDFVSDDPILAKAFLNIQEKFEQHIMDYKRLHTYLSHEQKNALSLLRANLELHHEEECFKNIDDISMGIDDLVTLSETKEITELKPVDVIILCAEVVDKYITHYPLLRYDFDEEALYVLAKPRWIICALNNLIDNAIKYGEKNEIFVTVKRIEDEVIISVKDYGIGIPIEKQKEIFEQHYRINELNKDGYGIGLSLVMHVCNLCKGKIICKSEDGKGSEFQMKLPVKKLSNISVS